MIDASGPVLHRTIPPSVFDIERNVMVLVTTVRPLSSSVTLRVMLYSSPSRRVSSSPLRFGMYVHDNCGSGAPPTLQVKVGGVAEASWSPIINGSGFERMEGCSEVVKKKSH